MNAYWSRPLSFPWPPMFYGISILSAILLGRYFPVDYLVNQPWILKVAGGFMIGAAVSIDLWALLTLRDRHTTVLPNRCATHLVTQGPFRFSRNPIYLGYTLMTVGLGLLTQNAWFLVLAPLAVALTYVIAIRAEENHLLARFGIDFEQYRRQTRCWI